MTINPPTKVRLILLGPAVGAITGVASGFGSASFLHALNWATTNRVGHPWLLWLLPVAGLGIGLLRRVAGRATAGTNLLLEDFHASPTESVTERVDGDAQGDGCLVDDRLSGLRRRNPDTVSQIGHRTAADGSSTATARPGRRVAGVPVGLAPYVFVGSVATHLFGGSGGREGAAVQIAAGLTAPVRPLLERLGSRSATSGVEVRRMLIVASLAGGFGSVFGVPWAGMIFGVEVARHWEMSGSHLRLRWEETLAFLPTAAVASFVGHLITSRLGIHHLKLPRVESPLVFGVVIVAFGAGVLARAYLVAHRLVVVALRRSKLPHLLWPVLGGALVVAGTAAIGTRAYLGLSLPLLNAALAGAGVASTAFILKLAFTAVTLGSGFPGGEVTPLLCMGACLGASLSGPLGEPAGLLAAVGMVATWAAASNTPISAAVMGAELFGPVGLLAFLPANIIATALSGRHAVYHAQR